MSRSRKLNDLHYILNPEHAKSVGDILGAIERWEERIQRLPANEQPTHDMQVALMSRLCTPKIREYIELHLSETITKHVLKEEIARLVESGVFGKTKEKNADDNGVKPMDLDNLDEEEYARVLAAFKGKGKGKCKGGFNSS